MTEIPSVATQKIAFIFPGQGSQAVGMGKDLAEKYPIARRTFEEADQALGYKLSQLCFEGPEDQLRLTEITQPAILTASIAALRVLEDLIPRPSFVAGHSLGEYSAHVASGTLLDRIWFSLCALPHLKSVSSSCSECPLARALKYDPLPRQLTLRRRTQCEN